MRKLLAGCSPNRRGDYPTKGGKPAYVGKGYRHLSPEGLQRRRPLPDVTHRRYGIRDRRRMEDEYGEKCAGFQLPLAREKPKVPGRVLRDAQEDELWLEEAHHEEPLPARATVADFTQ